MIKVNGYTSYDGGKSGNGTFQVLINHVPPCHVFCSLFLGNCGLTRYIKPAALNILNDKDIAVTDAWQQSGLSENYEIFNEDAIDVLIAINERLATIADSVFIYLDPPYLMETRKGKNPIYKFEMTTLDHQLLLDKVIEMDKIGFKFMISHYPNAMYDELLPTWIIHDFYSKIRNGMALERIYMNYELTDKLHDYTYIGGDFREREKNNRIKNNFVKKVKRMPEKLRNSIIESLIATYCDASGKLKSNQ
jgi:DNA adenine methylase